MFYFLLSLYTLSLYFFVFMINKLKSFSTQITCILYFDAPNKFQFCIIFFLNNTLQLRYPISLFFLQNVNGKLCISRLDLFVVHRERKCMFFICPLDAVQKLRFTETLLNLRLLPTLGNNDRA